MMDGFLRIDKELLEDLMQKAKASERKRINYDLRTSSEDSSQRMLNALLPGTKVAIHRHPHSSENVICLCGKIIEVLYKASPSLYPRFPQNGKEPYSEFLSISPKGEGELIEIERIPLDPSVGNFGCVVPANVWHTVEVLEPSVIYEAKDGRYGEDGSENWEDCKKKIQNENPHQNALECLASGDDNIEGSPAARNPKDNPENNPNKISSFHNSLGDLKKNIEYLIGMERHSGSMDVITPLYVSRMLNVPLEEVERVMKEMEG